MGNKPHSLQQEKIMAQSFVIYIARVGRNLSFRRGVAAAGVGALVAAVTELVWPSA
jgi:hypothetical protein